MRIKFRNHVLHTALVCSATIAVAFVAVGYNNIFSLSSEVTENHVTALSTASAPSCTSATPAVAANSTKCATTTTFTPDSSTVTPIHGTLNTDKSTAPLTAPVTASISTPQPTTSPKTAPKVPSATSLPSAAPKVVLVFGDSIITESQKELLAELGPDFEVKYRTFGGTAPCDWSEAATKTISDDHPDVVVTSFLANNFTPCTTLATGDALGAIFSTHLTIIANAALAVHAKMIMVVEPHPVAGVVGSYAQTASATWKAVDAINSTLLEQSGNSGAGPQVFASDDGVVLADQQALLQGVRSWPRELPCQADDAKVCQKDGSTVVRSADGIHLCPTHNNPIPGGLTCDQRSPGAYRFANSIAATIRAVLSGLPLPHPAPLCRCLD